MHIIMCGTVLFSKIGVKVLEIGNRIVEAKRNRDICFSEGCDCMYVKKGIVSIRPLQSGDEIYLLNWLTDKNVLRYYEGRDQQYTLEKIQEKYFQPSSVITRCLVQYNHRPIGYIQYYSLSKMQRKAYGYGKQKELIYGMDQFIGEPSCWNQGLGTRLVKLVTHYLCKVKHADRVVIDPQVWNDRAIHCYEKCGFKKMYILPEWEAHEGKREDCYLMVYESNLVEHKGMTVRRE